MVVIQLGIQLEVFVQKNVCLEILECDSHQVFFLNFILVGGLERVSCFHILGLIIPIDFHICSEG